MTRIVLGTRGSDLARAQTAMVEAAVRANHPAIEVAVAVITTRGDESTMAPPEPVDRRAGRKGMFTAEIERALLDGRVDVAVHSAKDLPSDASAGLEICAALPRAHVDDVLVAKTEATLSSLPAGATVATGSVRRQHQLRFRRPDIKVVDLRGNVPTRLRKLTENSWDAIVLARAGLERLGFGVSHGQFAFNGHALRAVVVDREDFLPAGGQGVIALQVRAQDVALRELLAPLNDEQTLLCLRAEREFLRLLQGDCDSPVGVLATATDGAITIRAQVFKPPTIAPVRGEVTGPAEPQHVEALAEKLMEQIHARQETNR